MDEADPTRRSVPNDHRNKVERQRQTGIDDEIQKLLCFLPQRKCGTRKMSRNQVLEELYRIVVDNMQDVIQPAEQRNDDDSKPSTPI